MDNTVSDTVRNSHQGTVRKHSSVGRLAACLGLVLGLLVALPACDSTPLPVAVWYPWSGNHSGECLGYVTISAGIVIATDGAPLGLGIVGGIGWDVVGDHLPVSYDDCLWTANILQQPFAVEFTCDGVHTYWVGFQKYMDALNYIQYTRCFTDGGGGGGGGGGVGGW